MMAKRRQQVRARLRRIFEEHDMRQMPMDDVWRLILQAEVYTDVEIKELCRQAHDRLVARVLLRDPALRRQAEALGLDDPLVRIPVQQAIDEDLRAEESGET
jgi:hypothetical protein